MRNMNILTGNLTVVTHATIMSCLVHIHLDAFTAHHYSRCLKPGKMQELAELIHRIKLDVVAIQEIRWSGTGVNKKKTSPSIMVEQITLARLELAFRLGNLWR